MELLTLVCVCNIFTSSADLVLPRCFPMADGTRLCTDVWQRRTDTLILFWDVPALFHSHIHAPFLEGQRALCSIARFYDIVNGLHCCNSAKELSQK